MFITYQGGGGVGTVIARCIFTHLKGHIHEDFWTVSVATPEIGLNGNKIYGDYTLMR